MEADGAMLGVVGNLRGNDHGRERKDVELGAKRAVLIDPLGNRLALASEALVAEQGPAALLGQGRERIRASALGWSVDANDVVAMVRETFCHVPAERRLPEDRNPQTHGKGRYMNARRLPTVPRGWAGTP